MQIDRKKQYKCTRCGLCCLLGNCGFGSDDEFDVCKELIIHKDLTTSCNIADKLNFIGTGCFLKRSQPVYKEMLWAMTEKKKWILKKRKFAKFKDKLKKIFSFGRSK